MTATPSVAVGRRDHQAFLLPNNNAVLIVGGVTAAGVSASAELYLPWLNQFWATGAMGVARQDATGSALSSESYGPPSTSQGLMMVAGGQGLSSSEAYGFATIKTDKDDYEPGQTVYVSGRGWQPNETLTLGLRELPGEHETRTFSISADDEGNIPTTELFLVEEHHIGVRFYLTVRGVATQAQTTFTDARVITAVSLTHAATTVSCSGASCTPSTPLTVTPGGTIAVTIDVTTSGSGNNSRWEATGWRISSTAPPPVTCENVPDPDVAGAGTNQRSFNITAPTSTGTYNAYFIAYRLSDCSGGTGANEPSATFILSNAITVAAQPTLKVVKHVVNDNGGTAAAADWELTVSSSDGGTGGGTADGSETGKTYTLQGGKTYSVTESGPAGYTESKSANCTNFVPVAGNTYTCTITNDDQPGTLTVIKHVVNDNGGTKVASDFSLTVTGTNVQPNATFAGAESPGTTVTLNAGSYSVDEAAVNGYTKTTRGQLLRHDRQRRDQDLHDHERRSGRQR